MNRHWVPRLILLPTLLLCLPHSALARTSNGNDFALAFSEARNDAERRSVAEDALGRPHFFRYLSILSIEEGESEGRPFYTIKSTEPASTYYVEFTVSKTQSIGKLREAPATGVGDAIAVSGKVVSADPETKRIALDRVIVRHKDRTTPKMGKELLTDLDPDAICYTYTVVEPAVMVPHRHRDLLKHKDRILGKQGPQAWAEFLRTELEKRKQAAP